MKRSSESAENETVPTDFYSHVTNYNVKYPPKINTFLSFRQHVACTNRFNLYIHNLKTQYEKNIYLRKLKENEYDIFLTQKFNSVWLLRAIFESINKSTIYIPIENNLILNMTSVYEDHLKRILDSDKKDHIQTWFDNVKRNYNTVPIRILDPSIERPTVKFKTRKYKPAHFNLKIPSENPHESREKKQRL